MLIYGGFLTFADCETSFRIFRNMVSPTPCTNCLFRHATFYCNFRYYTRQISSPLFHPELISKQIAMRSRPYQFQNQSLPNNFIDQQPVRLDVTFSHVLIISGISESMISIRLRQRLLVTQQRDHFLQLLRIAASLDRKLVISFELPRKLPALSIQRLHQICNAIKRTIHILSLFLPPPSPHR
nr:hypothetical protein [uncultured bacterium]